MNASYKQLQKELNNALKTIERKENDMDELRMQIQNLEDECDVLRDQLEQARGALGKVIKFDMDLLK